MENKIPDLKDISPADFDYTKKVGKPKNFDEEQMSKFERLIGVSEAQMESMSFEEAYSFLIKKFSGTTMKQKRKMLKELRKISKKKGR